ncbi:MAG: cysteine desulfurase family protein [Oscillospiraceae bacterium]
MINQKIHYLDNSATTKPCNEAVQAVVKCMTDTYGNPSSLHSMGTAAMKILENSRNIIANALKCSSDCITFTSGATESTNMAIKGAVRKYGRKRKKIITTSVEHSSVKEVCKYLETQGYDVVYISPDSEGKINPKQIFDEIDDNTCLVSMMLVNNETGYILPVEKTFTAIKKRFPHIITHCDCVQAFMKIPVDTRKLNADFISLSGHKVHAPKGTGILYTAKGIHIPPLVHGGGQEKNIRPGTEGLPLIAGFAAAVEKYSADISERYDYVTDLKNYLLRKISGIDGISVNSHDDALSYIINISAEGIRSEIMLHFLEERGIFISSGSACSKGAKSGVLSEFGINDRRADSALRISLCSDNDKSDIDALADGIAEGKIKIMN